MASPMATATAIALTAARTTTTSIATTVTISKLWRRKRRPVSCSVSQSVSQC
ncbi:hypothetical protein PF005_g24059 [Phytophthora fragariae]|uniref:Uncharacterized protein n=1 Tax=Phytophthora fragariae TaxID=53985 RepID=A0A6A3DSX0_9STRA|nr:hypothetical protein PF003_g29892 [Phytophthora fragariae]KAE8886191.1 hypothetical protein PF003_g29898 [Phytophthora fragariae]KAE8924922.1 hypothetical protein PF009_g24856 [Phytophthora fragariae]KAE8979522.1 hypothetical protein PF011_g22816 [Phytophthora fragariae]KAE9077858.1 hypothetical protein PF007_g24086 [Phytophthora fragariae]